METPQETIRMSPVPMPKELEGPFVAGQVKRGPMKRVERSHADSVFIDEMLRAMYERMGRRAAR